MGETIRGGYYKTADGKFRDANGNLVEEQSDKSREKAVEGQKDEWRPGQETTTGTPGNPGPLGPVVMPADDESRKNVEKSAEKPGVPGGKSSGKK